MKRNMIIACALVTALFGFVGGAAIMNPHWLVPYWTVGVGVFFSLAVARVLT